ncbi:hypothetical protein KK083_23725 [Fulvivirgaceae bacterium PWU4]|uniref:LVIVD repeat-containing protein n=1 Tax=Chryseosolibacter histidini TaxID=2782349 RepID=A0AAP2DRI5_9BACT|nr:hypothetical protein [Chryseosolibacter histidini]MBT1699917.1 hypothetical protein [Chryseosolibacter histidini]
MIRKTIKLFLFAALGLVLSGCPPGDPYPEFPVDEVEGYKPVYATDAEASIEFQEARPLKKPGKIYVYGKYLLVNEQSQGIHVIDNTDPSAPKPVGFLRVYGNVDMAVRNNVLYVDHIGDLVALQITDLNNIQEISRISSWSNDLPPADDSALEWERRGRYFECVDPEKGKVIGWILTTLKKPECYR